MIAMGLSVAASSAVVLIALVSAGTIAVATTVDVLSDNVHASQEAVDRLQQTTEEEIELIDGGDQGGDTETSWANAGSYAIDLDAVSLVVCGDWTAHDDPNVNAFEIDGHAASDVWAPGETLLVEHDQTGRDIMVAGPRGAAAFHRGGGC